VSRTEEFGQGQGQGGVRRFDAGDPELEEHVGQPATLIEGPRRWHGTLGRHWQTQSLKLFQGKKTMRGIDDWRHHVVEVGPDAKAHFQHWKAHATAKPPGPDCPKCREGI
jgi:hypothetical protein